MPRPLHKGAPSIWKERSQGESGSDVVCVIQKRLFKKENERWNTLKKQLKKLERIGLGIM